MYLANERGNKWTEWIARKKVLLATVAFAAISGSTQAETPASEIRDDIIGMGSGAMSAKLHTLPAGEAKNAGLFDLPLPETVKNIPVTAVSSIGKAALIADEVLGINPFLTPSSQSPNTFKDAAQTLENFDRLPTANVLEFTKLAYSANQQGDWSDEEKEIYIRLAVEEGWEICPFNGTTGAAVNQVDSISGFIAFKDNHVVIATRGTEMTNINDWMTNLRFSRSPFLRMFSSEEQNRLSSSTGQHFGFGGEIANGFLQTHMSSWAGIRNAILKRAQYLGVSPSDLKIIVTGHSLGGAKAQLIGVNLATDHALEIGVRKVEDSFVSVGDFYSPPVYAETENPQNVEIIVFGSPNVFTTEAANAVEKILGENIYRIENNDLKFFRSLDMLDMGDIVPSLPPRFLGFRPVGKRIGDEGKQGFSVGRHVMSNISKAALDEVDAARLVTLLARRETLGTYGIAAAPAA